MNTRRPGTRTKRAKRTPARARGARKATDKARQVRAGVETRDYIRAAAQVLGLAIEPEWQPAIEANFTTTLRLAASFMDFPLPDEAEPAPGA